MSKKISCIILACDSHINKGKSIFHSLLSVVKQDYSDIEIIIVENSHKESGYLSKLEKKFIYWRKSSTGKISLKIINNGGSFNRGCARNIGLRAVTGSIVVFLDDDTILLGRDYFSRVMKLSCEYDYGYGANRNWTKDKLFQKRACELLESLEGNNMIKLKSIVGSPTLSGRQDGDYIDFLKKHLLAIMGLLK